MDDRIRGNSYALLYYNRTKKWLVRLSRKEELHTHIGVIRHADAIGREFGSRILTSKGKYVYLFRPTAYDFVMKIEHGTQIVYPKDLGYVVARAGIRSGQTVVEIGTGSGALTSFLAGIVRPRGRIHTFDVDPGFMAVAERNIRKAGMEKHVEMNLADVRKARRPPVEGADAAIIDLGDPWTALPAVRRMLKGSGSVTAVCPTMNQLEKLAAALAEHEFADIECSEHILRTIDAREGKTRHSFQAIGHTTYLCFARKAFFGRAARGATAAGVAKKRGSEPAGRPGPPAGVAKKRGSEPAGRPGPPAGVAKKRGSEPAGRPGPPAGVAKKRGSEPAGRPGPSAGVAKKRGSKV